MAYDGSSAQATSYDPVQRTTKAPPGYTLSLTQAMSQVHKSFKTWSSLELENADQPGLGTAATIDTFPVDLLKDGLIETTARKVPLSKHRPTRSR